ncbi:DUF4362 domain-containing protein [Psychrobacillus sp. FSL K6-1267]|uniref:DUF4362 domain-containing protein n=1 Tax=Psychrobacillus sp. FSL K6-1267 TaxID=2921543 RepID=UPI0030FC9073
MKKKLMFIFVFAMLLIGCQEEGSVIQSRLPSLPDYTPSSEDIVDTHGDLQNFNRFEEFLSNLNNEQKDNLRIVTYTTEGDPILRDLAYDGNVIISKLDTRRDHFGAGSLKTTSCSSLVTVLSKTRTDYELEGCQDEYDKNVLVIHH